MKFKSKGMLEDDNNKLSDSSGSKIKYAKIKTKEMTPKKKTKLKIKGMSPSKMLKVAKKGEREVRKEFKDRKKIKIKKKGKSISFPVIDIIGTVKNRDYYFKKILESKNATEEMKYFNEMQQKLK